MVWKKKGTGGPAPQRKRKREEKPLEKKYRRDRQEVGGKPNLF